MRHIFTSYFNRIRLGGQICRYFFAVFWEDPEARNLLILAGGRRIRAFAALTLAWACAFVAPSCLFGDIFPAGCDKASGGQGNTDETSIGFIYHQAHLGDTVQVLPTLGMVGPKLPQTGGACEALNATGSVYIASGLVVRFLDNVTLDPGFIYQCPTNTTPPCTVGPYNVTIVNALVGADVTYPKGTIAGTPNSVRAVQWSFSNKVRSNPSGFETLDRTDTDSISIVHPCIQVVKQRVLPQGRTCFVPGDNALFNGYVTNCGDISLTNVIVNDSCTGRLILLDPVSGVPLATNAQGGVTLAAGAFANYATSYTPSQAASCAGVPTNSVTATGTDTTAIGGPNASVTNSASATCPFCVTPCITVSLSNRVPTIVWTSIPGKSYRVQYRPDLSSGTFWSNLIPDVVASASTATNRDNTLGTASQRFYRVVVLP